MPKPEPTVEDILSRLMPTALSPSAELEMGHIIDELATGVDEQATSRPWPKWPWLGAAAAIALTAWVAALAWDPVGPGKVQTASAADGGASLRSLGVFERLESVVDSGWHQDSAGKAVQTLSVRMIAEEQLLDEHTGILMTVSEPREEVLLVPVNAF